MVMNCWKHLFYRLCGSLWAKHAQLSAIQCCDFLVEWLLKCLSWTSTWMVSQASWEKKTLQGMVLAANRRWIFPLKQAEKPLLIAVTGTLYLRRCVADEMPNLGPCDVYLLQRLASLVLWSNSQQLAHLSLFTIPMESAQEKDNGHSSPWCGGWYSIHSSSLYTILRTWKCYTGSMWVLLLIY